MLVLGLTGSIAMGKSTAAGMFRRLGVPVHDSDAAVHRLLGPGGQAVARVDAVFPGTDAGGFIDHGELAKRVFGDNQALTRLESLLHPLVEADQDRFLAWAARWRKRVVVLDVPLLYETGMDHRCDRVAVVSAPAFLQAQRALARPGMTGDRLKAILSRQVPDAEKRRRADFVIPTGLGRRFTFVMIGKIIRKSKQDAGGKRRRRFRRMNFHA